MATGSGLGPPVSDPCSRLTLPPAYSACLRLNPGHPVAQLPTVISPGDFFKN